MGQKRAFVPAFRKALEEFRSATTFVDLFGGSGLLSHVVKHDRPDARVIYNDFDDFHIRIRNVDRTNGILDEIRAIIAEHPIGKAIPEPRKKSIVELLERREQTGFVDYITISSSILFSANYAKNLAELRRETLYNNIRRTPYRCDGYLDNLEIVKYDYRELYARYAETPGVVFLVDPPYLSTQAGHYNGYWRLADYLDVFDTILHRPFFYFTSDKSSVVEFFEWMDARGFGSPFRGSTKMEITGRSTGNSKYTDIMIYKTQT